MKSIVELILPLGLNVIIMGVLKGISLTKLSWDTKLTT